MAFGIKKTELMDWKKKVSNGEIAFITHYWSDERFDNITSVTKVGCSDKIKLINWGKKYGLKLEWLHNRESYPHFDLIGETQARILIQENQIEQYNKFIGYY